jgi:hypothetical protein
MPRVQGTDPAKSFKGRTGRRIGQRVECARIPGAATGAKWFSGEDPEWANKRQRQPTY